MQLKTLLLSNPALHSTHLRTSSLTSVLPLAQTPPSLLLPPLSPTRLFLSSSHHSVEGPSDIWLSPASRGSRRCRRFWQAGTGTPRGPDGDSWTRKRKRVHIIKCTRSQKHTYALGVHMHKQTIARKRWRELTRTHTPTHVSARARAQTLHAPANQTRVMKTQRTANVRRRGKLPPTEKFWKTANKLGI